MKQLKKLFIFTCLVLVLNMGFTGYALPINTCEGRCGGKATGTCYCDDLCREYGDCCPDYSQQCLESQPLKLVGNAQVKSTLITDKDQLDIAGRTSFYLEADEEDIKKGLVRVKGLNLVYFKVPQAPLSSGSKPKNQKGTLGFAADLSSEPQYLEYNPKYASISGTVKGYVDADFMADLVDAKFDGKNDIVKTPRQEAELHLNMKLSAPLSFAKNDSVMKNAALDIDLEAYANYEFDIIGYEITLENNYIKYESHIYATKVVKNLRIQPVRIRNNGGRLSGAGLHFGLPGAVEQWAKADVVFTINDWKTLSEQKYWTLTEDETSSLLSEVDVENAVEVFFVYEMPEELNENWGGGATWGLGTASTQIITTDGNARGGIDLTHLAHELGHSMGLAHPGDPYGRTEGSVGTLMCPSGWMKDNPQINSQENADNISNPLFIYALTKQPTDEPDCEDSKIAVSALS